MDKDELVEMLEFLTANLGWTLEKALIEVASKAPNVMDEFLDKYRQTSYADCLAWRNRRATV